MRHPRKPGAARLPGFLLGAQPHPVSGLGADEDVANRQVAKSHQSDLGITTCRTRQSGQSEFSGSLFNFKDSV